MKENIMRKNYENEKELLSPPGDTIQETIDILGMSQYELAERLGKNIKNVNQIIKGKESISSETAIALEKVLGIPADFWLERERQFRKELAKIVFDEYLEECKEWIIQFPTKIMIKLGWIKNVNDKIELIKEVLTFFGIASPREWEQIYMQNDKSVAFRMSLAHINEPQAISAWLRKGEIDARKLKVNMYVKEKFKKVLDEIKIISFKHPKEYPDLLQQLCAEAGVALIYTPNLPGATISGASRWIFNLTVPLIQLSGRYKTNDHFWFTFFHEAGHILLHGKKDIFLEEVSDSNTDSTKEHEADDFARKWLIDSDEFNNLIVNEKLTKDTILKFSSKTKVHPGIIVGRLQHDGYISHSSMNELKEKVSLFN